MGSCAPRSAMKSKPSTPTSGSRLRAHSSRSVGSRAFILRGVNTRDNSPRCIAWMGGSSKRRYPAAFGYRPGPTRGCCSGPTRTWPSPRSPDRRPRIGSTHRTRNAHCDRGARAPAGSGTSGTGRRRCRCRTGRNESRYCTLSLVSPPAAPVSDDLADLVTPAQGITRSGGPRRRLPDGVGDVPALVVSPCRRRRPHPRCAPGSRRRSADRRAHSVPGRPADRRAEPPPAR
jgi:hypothetical protein